MLDWSEEKILATRRWAQCGNLFMELVAKSKLAAVDRDLATAGQILDELLEKFAGRRQEHGLLPHISTASIIARRPAIAKQLIAERIAPEWRVDVRLIPQKRGRAGAVRWILPGSKTMIFEINEDVFASDHTEFFLQGWIYYLPLYVAYTNDPDVQQGWVDINLNDRAIGPGLHGGEARHDCFLIPDKAFIHAAGYEEAARQYRRDDVPWHARQSVALWRGSTTGIMGDGSLGWRSLPRIRLCEIARAPVSRGLIDAGITSITQITDPAAIDEIRESGLICPQMPAAQFNRYRYQIDIDGNVNAWPGLFLKLLTGSPVLKVASPHGFRQWYYDKLQPWVNFVPVAADMSDLIEKIEWLKAHDHTARQIGMRGCALAKSLKYSDELKRAGRTISAALCYFSGRPEVILRFGTTEDTNIYLRDGWSWPEDSGVPAVGIESRIELQRPIAAEDFVLTLELSPVGGSVMPEPQRTSVLANGEILLQAALSKREELRCLLPRRVIDRAERLTLTLLHPDGMCGASAERPLETRVLSVTLHRLELMPLSLQSAAATAYCDEDTDNFRIIDPGHSRFASARHT